MTTRPEQLLRRASVGVVLACGLLVLSTTALLWLSLPAALDSNDTGLAVGDILSVPNRSGGGTMVVFLRSDCAASQAASAWLPELRHKMTQAGIRTLAAVSADGGERELVFARSAGFAIDDVWVTDFEQLPLQAVPSFILLDANGRVTRQRASVGDAAEREFFLSEWIEIRSPVLTSQR